MKKEFAMWHRRRLEIVSGKLVNIERHERVRVLSRAEGYAMVRKPRAMPFVVPEKELAKDWT